MNIQHQLALDSCFSNFKSASLFLPKSKEQLDSVKCMVIFRQGIYLGKVGSSRKLKYVCLRYPEARRYLSVIQA